MSLDFIIGFLFDGLCQMLQLYWIITLYLEAGIFTNILLSIFKLNCWIFDVNVLDAID